LQTTEILLDFSNFKTGETS